MYLDLLMFTGTVVHYFLLRLTAMIFHRQTSWRRLLTGAVLGASAVLLLPFLHLKGLVVAVILAAPLLMILAAFGPLPMPELLCYWTAFFMVAFTMAGAVTALLNHDSLRRYFATTGGILLLFGTGVTISFMLALLRSLVEDKKWQRLWRAKLQVAWQGKEKTVPAFLDTGNRLRDPFSNVPVIVIDYRSLKGLLPTPLYRVLADESQEPWSALETLTDPAQACSFTLIPCHGISGGEILLGLKPDRVVLHRGGQSRSLGSGVFLGLARRGFGPAAEYRALLPPALLRAG